MKQIRLLLLPALLLLFSCADNTNRVLSKTSKSEQVLVPDNLEIYNSSLKASDFAPGNANYTYKLFTTINVSCATCILKLEKWEKFQAQVKSCSNVLLAPVCTSKDKFEMIKYLFEDHKINKFDYPLLLDSSQAFGKLNKRLSDDMSGVSVLTNSDNEVILTGNPIEDDADRQRFIDMICKPNAKNN